MAMYGQRLGTELRYGTVVFGLIRELTFVRLSMLCEGGWGNVTLKFGAEEFDLSRPF